MMGSFVYFFILLIILQVLSPLLYAYPIVGLLLWVGIIGWFLYRNKNSARLSTKRSNSSKIIISSNSSRTPLPRRLSPVRTSMKKT